VSAFATRRSYAELRPYRPDRRPCAVDLSDNTNLWGSPPAALAALREGAGGEARYPAAQADALREALAGYAGVRPEEVVTGCGSDDVLDSALRALAEPGARLAFPWPTFTMIPDFARMNGLKPVPVALRADGQPDAEALLRAAPDLVYLCSPNNPTGLEAEARTVERLLAESGAVLILDEAYAEFAGAGWLGSAPAHPRLLVVRTLSKAFGLAGVRVGYAAGSAALVAEVEKSRGPYKVSTPAETAARAALSPAGLAWVRARVEEARSERAFLGAEAARIPGVEPLSSRANFVLLRLTGGREAAEVAGALRERGVAVRPFAALPGLGEALRVTVGPRPLLESFLDALAEVLR
jgi:histidinol-phosphate aminotransferase